MAFGIYFLITLLIFSGTDGKSINIEIDTEDLIKTIKGLMNSDIIRKFSEHVYKRHVGSHKSYYNPFHPEDEITSFFDEALTGKINRTLKLNIGNSNTKSAIDNKKINADSYSKQNTTVSISHDNQDILRNSKNKSTTATKLKISDTEINALIALYKNKPNEYATAKRYKVVKRLGIDEINRKNKPTLKQLTMRKRNAILEPSKF